jgi:Arc/MetJ-type ribon-helix-helix transcriptional regulator
MSAENEDEYTTIRIPKELASELDSLIGKKGFRTKAEIVKQAIRDLINYYRELDSREPPPRFEKINSDENGVKILDRTLGDDVQVFIKPTGVMCGYDKTDDCDHVRYALSFPEVRELIKKHHWKLPDI